MNVLLVFHPQNPVFVWVYPQKDCSHLKHPQLSKKSFYSPIYEIKPYLYPPFLHPIPKDQGSWIDRPQGNKLTNTQRTKQVKTQIQHTMGKNDAVVRMRAWNCTCSADDSSLLLFLKTHFFLAIVTQFTCTQAYCTTRENNPKKKYETHKLTPMETLSARDAMCIVTWHTTLSNFYAMHTHTYTPTLSLIHPYSTCTKSWIIGE